MYQRGGRIASSTRRALIVLPIWLCVTAWMWTWWLQPSRSNFSPLFIPLTLAMFYEFALLPSIFLYFLLRAKNPPRRVTPKGKKVAVISLCVPKKESLRIIEAQLKAMAAIEYPHDSWILDEGGSKRIEALAKKHGVKYFTRKGIEKYNQEGPPFKAKTKAGNVNAWLDRVKRYNYDYFVQFDIDHLAHEDYLDKTIRYFNDKKVAWVQAPSVYKNLDSWTARGSAEQELVLQGPLQMGFYGHSDTPFIIGSHCTYRMNAVREIGGFQPTRAEDHLDTVVLSNHGYKGVFVPEIIAEGDGPDTLATYLAQQFAWAYSMFQVLTQHSHKLFRGMPMRKQWQFLFAQTWYPLWTLAYLIMFMTPILSLLINKDVANIGKGEFFSHFVPMFVCGFMVWWAARPVMQGKGVRLTWRGMLLHTVRWPVIFRAILSAGFKIKKPYMITPKGMNSGAAPTISTYRPFLFFGALSMAAVAYGFTFHRDSNLQAQMIYALLNAILMISICVVDLNLQLKLSGFTIKTKLQTAWLRPVIAVSAAVLFSVATLIASPLVTNQAAYALNDQLGLSAHDSSVDVAFSVLTTEQLISQIRALEQRSSTPNVGVFDPMLTPHRTSQPYIQHYFVDWRDTKTMAQNILLSQRVGQSVLVTIEPKGNPDGADLLNGIVNGRYDIVLDELGNVLTASQQPLYVRFAHEMELYNIYPWGNQDPQLFIAAYRYVVAKIDAHQSQNTIQWMWSPAGNPGADDYYPGDDVVDVIGTTVLHDRFWYGDASVRFKDLIEKRLWLRSLGKPLWIVEFGAGNANANLQSALVNEAFSTFQSYGLSAILYLNIRDANIAGPNYQLPSLALLSKFVASDPMPLPSTAYPNKTVQVNARTVSSTCPVMSVDTPDNYLKTLVLASNVDCQ